MSRPYADTLKASRVKNLKELRVQSKGHVYRVAFVFGRKRTGVLLIGDDKKGQADTPFYQRFVSLAEKLYDTYAAEMEKEAEGH